MVEPVMSVLRSQRLGVFGISMPSLEKIVCEYRDAALLFKLFASTWQSAAEHAAVYPVPFLGDNPRIVDCSVPYRSHGKVPLVIVFTVKTGIGLFKWNCMSIENSALNTPVACSPLAAAIGSVDEHPHGTAVSTEHGAEQPRQSSRGLEDILTDEKKIEEYEWRLLTGGEESEETEAPADEAGNELVDELLGIIGIKHRGGGAEK